MKAEYEKLVNRIDQICKAAFDSSVPLFIDAEETWIQDGIDRIIRQMSLKYNSKRAIVYNTIQMYRHDRLEFLDKSYQKAVNGGYKLGMKLVRGAYMEKERARAKALNYLDPIHKSKEDTDKCFNDSMLYMFENVNLFSIFIGSHNEVSNYLALEYINNFSIKTYKKNVII